MREALQVLEHAELVYLTVESEGPDNWRATRSGLAALAGGSNVVTQRITERTSAAPVSPPAQSTAHRLQELEGLRATGVISQAEYTAKRERIIDEI